MKKLGGIEIFIGLLTIVGAFLVGEQAISTVILVALVPLTAKKISKEKIDFEKHYKIGNSLFAFSVIILLAIGVVLRNFPQNTGLWLPLTVGTVIFFKGLTDFLSCR